MSKIRSFVSHIESIQRPKFQASFFQKLLKVYVEWSAGFGFVKLKQLYGDRTEVNLVEWNF